MKNSVMQKVKICKKRHITMKDKENNWKILIYCLSELHLTNRRYITQNFNARYLSNLITFFSFHFRKEKLRKSKHFPQEKKMNAPSLVQIVQFGLLFDHQYMKINNIYLTSSSRIQMNKEIAVLFLVKEFSSFMKDEFISLLKTRSG